jgi:hypothetical protein
MTQAYKPKPVNTNDLRDYADRTENPYASLILDAASDLDAARTERNIERAARLKAEAELAGLRELCREASALYRQGGTFPIDGEMSQRLAAAMKSPDTPEGGT